MVGSVRKGRHPFLVIPTSLRIPYLAIHPERDVPVSTSEPRIHIIGVGSDGLASLPSRSRDILLAADVVFGPESVLNLLSELKAERRPVGHDLPEVTSALS